MASLDKRSAIKLLKNLMYSQKTPVATFRATLDKTFTVLTVPNNVDCRRVRVNGLACELHVPEASAKKRMVLYVHGGSFIGGSCAAWRSFCASFANTSSTRVIVPELRLAPEFPFPSAMDDILVVYKKMCERNVDVYLAGDTSGAILALSTALNLHPEQMSFLKGIILFSPWLNLSPDSVVASKKNADPLFSNEVLKSTSSLYTYPTNLNNPKVSPLLAASEAFSLFPPVFIQYGSEEPQREEIITLRNILQENNISCTVDEWKGLFHFFQMADRFVPQAHLAVERAGQFIRTSARTDFTEDDEWN